jgi:hypothetical protein
MNNTYKNKSSRIFLLLLPLLFSISLNQANAVEKETNNAIESTEIKKEAAKKTCLKFVQLKRPEQRAYSKCVKHTYDKGRCYKKFNLCLK